MTGYQCFKMVYDLNSWLMVMVGWILQGSFIADSWFIVDSDGCWCSMSRSNTWSGWYGCWWGRWVTNDNSWQLILDIFDIDLSPYDWNAWILSGYDVAKVFASADMADMLPTGGCLFANHFCDLRQQILGEKSEPIHSHIFWGTLRWEGGLMLGGRDSCAAC